MHDIRAIRENPTAFDAGLAKRGLGAMSTLILALDEARRTKILASETAQAAQNAASKEVGAAKAAGNDVEFERLRALVAEKKAEIGRLTDEASAKDAELRAALETIPNIPDASVPMGADEKDNQEVSRWGTPATFDFPPKEHFEIAGPQKGFDFTTAGKISGSRFVVLKAAITRLHRALGQFMLDTHVTEHDLTEVWTPVLVKEEAMYGTGQLPKFAEDSYQTTNGWWLVPTAEVTLTNMVAGEVVDEAALPLRLTAHTQCFRSEA
ncbi:MAG: serine--tRNA ligase, partial [Paracoccaceae bacterium]|nr:serine--tRNA ligase [Paracoccaceae bacterium]